MAANRAHAQDNHAISELVKRRMARPTYTKMATQIFRVCSTFQTIANSSKQQSVAMQETVANHLSFAIV